MRRNCLIVRRIVATLTAVLPFCASATPGKELPQGFVPVSVPFKACSGVNVTSLDAVHFRSLSASEVQRFREQVKDLPAQFTQPVGLLLSARETDESAKTQRAELARLVTQEMVRSVQQQMRLTTGLRERCLAPVQNKTEWPEEFPETCQPDLAKVNSTRLLVDHLNKIPTLLNVFRVYYALASTPPDAPERRLWEFESQVNVDLKRESLIALPLEREHLSSFERDVARTVFSKEWISILEAVLQSQKDLLVQLESAPSWTRTAVQRRVEVLTHALARRDQPSEAIAEALSWPDRNFQGELKKQWRAARFRFLHAVFGALNEARVVGLMKRSEAEIADLDEAYALMQSYQAEELARFQTLASAPEELSNKDLVDHLAPLETVLRSRKDLCGAATLAYYQNANSDLRRGLLTLAAAIGLSQMVPAPVVFVSAMAYSIYEIVNSETKFAQAWKLHESANFQMGAVSSAEDMVRAMDVKLMSARAGIVNASGITGLKLFTPRLSEILQP